MKSLRTFAGLLAVCAPLCFTNASAQNVTGHSPSAAGAAVGEDALAPVYLVSSDATYRAGIQNTARSGFARKDSFGHSLVISEVKAHQLPAISETIHTREKRCGGFFAFDTLAEAEAFIRSDQTTQAVQRAALVSYTIDNQTTVNPWLSQVQASNILSTISHLSTSYNNRYYSTATGQQSANWIRDTWAGLVSGRTDASAALFTSCSTCSTQPSVILTIQGNELPNEIVVLGAHLDSISSSGSGSNMNAPGADDDASGIATLTEVIRVAAASGWKPQRTIMFMGYAAEEVGLRGSNAIAQSFKTQGKNVVGVLQLDMTNYKVGTGVDMQLITDNSNAALKQFLTDLFDTYLQPLGLTRGTYTCGYGCSDHASWTSAGFPAAMMFEAGDETGEYFPYIHTSSDTLTNMSNSAANSAKFAKLGLAFLGELGKTNGGGGPGPGPGTQTYSNTGDYTINDNATVDSPITVSGRSGNAPSNASVTVAIVHTYIGDLKVDLVAPDGTLYNIHNRSGGSADNINKTVTLNLSSETLNGTWKLRANDNASQDTGKIDSWSVTF